MIEVKNRSEAAWGPLAATSCSDKEFHILTVSHTAREDVKSYLKRKKKLKKYKVQFVRESCSEYIEVEAESEYDVSTEARKYFRENEMQIGFKRGKEDGYDRVSYHKVRG